MCFFNKYLSKRFDRDILDCSWQNYIERDYASNNSNQQNLETFQIRVLEIYSSRTASNHTF